MGLAGSGLTLEICYQEAEALAVVITLAPLTCLATVRCRVGANGAFTLDSVYSCGILARRPRLNYPATYFTYAEVRNQ